MGGISSKRQSCHSQKKKLGDAETTFADFSLQDVPGKATGSRPPSRAGAGPAVGRHAVLYELLVAKEDSVFGVVPAALVVQLRTIQFPKGIKTNFEDLKCPLPGLTAAQTRLCQGTPDSFEMSPAHMLLHFFIMMQELGLFESLEIPPAKMQHLFTDIHNGYRENPYHNFHHAFETCQIGFACLLGFPHRKLMDPLLMMAFMLASLGHDIDHPGYSNDFLVRTKDPLAILFHNRSVLENSHAAVIALMLERGMGTNICENLVEKEKKYMVEAIVDFVLATDMFLHDVVLKEFASLDVQQEAKSGALGEKTQLSILRMVMKVADLGHVVQPFTQAKRWDDFLMEEFFAEGDRDREQGRKPIAMHNRHTANVNKTCNWFYKNMCKPMVEAYKVCSPVHGAKLVGALDQNVVVLDDLLLQDGDGALAPHRAASVYGKNRPTRPVHYNMMRDNSSELSRMNSAVSQSSLGSALDSARQSADMPESPEKVTKVPGKTSPSKNNSGATRDGGNKRRKSRFV